MFSMRKTKGWLVVAIAASAIVFATGANANTYNLTIDNCTGGCSTGVSPFGTVTVVTDLSNSANLDFTVSLNSPYLFNPNGNGLDAFVFGFTDRALASSDVTNLTSGFAFDTSIPQHEDGFGDFKNGITTGTSNLSVLSFIVLNETIDNLALSTGNGGTHVLFAADIVGNGNTGPVGGSSCTNCENPPPNNTPLPGALPLFTSGMGLLGFLGWRRKRRNAKQAV